MSSLTPTESTVVWRPSAPDVERSRLTRLMRTHDIGDYDALFRRSVEDLDWFWNAVNEDLALQWIRPYRKVFDSSAGVPWTKWWIDGKYNYVQNCLDRHLPKFTEKVAIRYEGEEGTTSTMTYGEVLGEVNRLANGLKRLGIRKGDRVGIFMPFTPECAIATLAVSRIGAIYIPIFSGFGAAAVATRLADCGAVALITADSFPRRGRPVPMKETADEALRSAPTVRDVIVSKRQGSQVPWNTNRDHWWDDVVKSESEDCPLEPTDAEDPFMIIYTSGTTGRPKGTVHVHGGFPIKGAMDMAYGFDFKDSDSMFWLTDLGWMMGPWEIIGVLTLGGTMLLYDGAIDHPEADRLWALLERHKITVVGISPTAIRAVMRHGEEPVKRHDLSALRLLGSTGEPWNPEPWLWYFHHVGGGRCPVLNYSGGTEISGGIVGCTILHPQKPCCFTGPVLGIDADVYDERGRPVRGAVGELVIRKPWPGMTRGFWRDPERYIQTYWSRWSDVWVHGDWVSIDDDGFWFIQGRSDDTIKVAGKRVGPAEVESALVSHPGVSEAAAIGIPDELKGEKIVCFAVLKPEVRPSDHLRESLTETVVRQLGKSLRPDRILFVRDLPKTRNAKIMRRVIRSKYLNADPGDLSSLENPQAVDEIGKAI
jgi:acetyl-CoA synthetase